MVKTEAEIMEPYLRLNSNAFFQVPRTGMDFKLPTREEYDEGMRDLEKLRKYFGNPKKRFLLEKGLLPRELSRRQGALWFLRGRLMTKRFVRGYMNEDFVGFLKERGFAVRGKHDVRNFLQIPVNRESRAKNKEVIDSVLRDVESLASVIERHRSDYFKMLDDLEKVKEDHKSLVEKLKSAQAREVRDPGVRFAEMRKRYGRINHSAAELLGKIKLP